MVVYSDYFYLLIQNKTKLTKEFKNYPDTHYIHLFLLVYLLDPQ